MSKKNLKLSKIIVIISVILFVVINIILNTQMSKSKNSNPLTWKGSVVNNITNPKLETNIDINNKKEKNIKWVKKVNSISDTEIANIQVSDFINSYNSAFNKASIKLNSWIIDKKNIKDKVELFIYEKLIKLDNIKDAVIIPEYQADWTWNVKNEIFWKLFTEYHNIDKS